MTSIPSKIYSFTSYFWFATGTGLMLVTPLAITVVLNRTGSSHDLGLYALAYAVTAPMHAFFGIQARTFIAIDRLYGHDPVDMAAQRFHMTAGLLVGAGLIATLRGFQWHEVAVFAAMCLIRAAEGTAEVSAGMMQRRHRPDLIALVYGARAVASIAVFAFLYLAGYGLAAALGASAVAGLGVFAFFDRAVLRQVGAPLHWMEIARSIASRRPLRLFRRLLPAGLVVLFSVAETNLPRYVVEYRVGLVELGIFASLSFVLYAATNLILPVYQMTIAPLGQWAKRANEQGLRGATRIVVVNLLITAMAGAILVLLVAEVGTSLMSWGFGPQYGQQGPLLMALGVGAAVGMLRSCLGFALTALDVVRAQTVLSLGNMALFAILVITGAGGHGLVGLAWAWTGACAATAVAGLILMAEAIVRLKRTSLPAARPQGV